VRMKILEKCNGSSADGWCEKWRRSETAGVQVCTDEKVEVWIREKEVYEVKM